MIPTFPEPSDHVPHAILRPCLPKLRSITLALIVSNCLSFSCCTMIRDIAPHAPSVLFLPGIVSTLRASLTLFHRVYKFPMSCMFLHSEYRTRLISCLVLLDSSDKLNPTLRIPRTSELYVLRTSTSLVFVLVLGIVPVHIPFRRIPETQSVPPFKIPWTRLKVGAAHELMPFPGTLRTSEFPALISEDFE